MNSVDFCLLTWSKSKHMTGQSKKKLDFTMYGAGAILFCIEKIYHPTGYNS
jgi:hypothetical protein